MQYRVTVTDDQGQSGTYDVEAERAGMAQTMASLAFVKDPAVNFVSGSALTHDVVEVEA